MNEHFLSFIWQFQQFTVTTLNTSEHQALQVLETGSLNQNAGADFSFARIIVDNVEWFGNVEIHHKSSDWYKHQHEQNPNYNNVILHVVWEDDKPILRPDNTRIPTLVLNEIVNKDLLYRFEKLIAEKEKIPCYKHFEKVSNIKRITMLDRALMKRLERKALSVKAIWQKVNNDWEETAYCLLAQNFGFKVNQEAFLALAEKTPYKTLLKHSDNLLQLEAILFGQSGLIDEELILKENGDEYFSSLLKEYKFLKKKYQLEAINYQHWNFLRLRPANFPTIRLAQFAMIIHTQKSLFSLLINQDFNVVKQSFGIKQSSYWQEHYVFGKKAQKKVPKLGAKSMENILINTAVPLLVLYAKQKSNQAYMDKAINTLEQLPAENNKILEKWAKLGIKVKTAFDSQALIEQYTQLCKDYKCLHCNVGVSIVNN